MVLRRRRRPTEQPLHRLRTATSAIEEAAQLERAAEELREEGLDRAAGKATRKASARRRKAPTLPPTLAADPYAGS